MADDEISKLAEALASSAQLSEPMSKLIINAMLLVSEQVIVVDSKRSSGLDFHEMSEALTAVSESAQALGKLHASIINVAEAGQIGALIAAIKAANEDNPDVVDLARSLRMISEPGIF